jgi:hypothetical protein
MCANIANIGYNGYMNTKLTSTTGTTSRVYFGGSRSFAGRSSIAAVVNAALRSNCLVSVGCAVGADALVCGCVVGAGSARRLSVFAVGGLSGAGFWSGSAVSVVSAAARAGAQVSWWAGGGEALPLRARLVRRSQAGLVGASVACFFLASPESAGSLRVASLAAAAGVPVFAFCGSRPAALVGLLGAWVPGSFAGLSAAGGLPCWAWSPAVAQPALF